jgi:DNA-binding NarL/FixJ family response regulator
MLERVTALAMRIRKILEGSKICVIDTNSERQLINSLTGVNEHVSLVILDLENANEYSLDMLIETRKRLSNTPIIILTAGRKKSFFIEAMLHGATDFIVKPFSDDVLVEKVFKYLNSEVNNNNIELVTQDLSKCISGELRKAEKGKFPLSLMFLHFENKSDQIINDTMIGNFMLENMKDLFWDTDIFIRFASKYYLGIFPFCDQKNTTIVKAKLQKRFEELKDKNDILENYDMISLFVSYPFDTSEKDDVYKLLIQKINHKLNTELK